MYVFVCLLRSPKRLEYFHESISLVKGKIKAIPRGSYDTLPKRNGPDINNTFILKNILKLGSLKIKECSIERFID